jgi:hypothetical protein
MEIAKSERGGATAEQAQDTLLFKFSIFSFHFSFFTAVSQS